MLTQGGGVFVMGGRGYARRLGVAGVGGTLVCARVLEWVSYFLFAGLPPGPVGKASLKLQVQQLSDSYQRATSQPPAMRT